MTLKITMSIDNKTKKTPVALKSCSNYKFAIQNDVGVHFLNKFYVSLFRKTSPLIIVWWKIRKTHSKLSFDDK